jgi:EpsI family protein
MNSRRAFIIGGACLGAAGAAYALTPRRRYSLVGDVTLSSLVPISFGPWAGRDASDLVAPPSEGSLEARLYQETVERVYQHQATGAQVMMLLAHGAAQTNELQLHRPEVCYPAFGFRLSGSRVLEIPVTSRVAVPSRRLIADAPQRRESIVYWTRLGDYLPVDGSQQRVDRVKLAMQGLIADGVLSRVSMIGENAEANTAVLSRFVSDLLLAASDSGRRALIGSALANAFA